MLAPVPPPAAAAAAAAAYRCLLRETPVAMLDPGRRWLPRSVAEVLKTSQLPDHFVGALLPWFRLSGPDWTLLSTDHRKGGGLHAFLGRLTAKAAPVPGLAELTLLGVDWDGGAHILHSLFSVPVGPYDPYRQIFGCNGELPAEGLTAITEILVASFAALRAVSTVSWEDHQVHLEGVPPLWLA